MPAQNPDSYRQIAKSTSIVGTSSVLGVIIGIIRTKALAVLLGPAGVGLAGMLQSATNVVGTLTGLGLSQVAVRQIAEAAGTQNEDIIARTIHTIRRTALMSGLFGMLIVLIFYHPITLATFGNLDYTKDIALVSLTLLFSSISTSQLAILQGLRRLKELAISSVLGNIMGLIVSVAIVFFLRDQGIALFLVAVSVFCVLPSWWYTQKIKFRYVKLTIRQLFQEINGLLGMGVAFTISAMLFVSTLYIIRILIIRELGMNAVGLYTATWTLSSLYVGIILNSMAADYYPRLTAVASNNNTVNQIVNEQTEMCVLLSFPGILATLAFSEYILQIFYSSDFSPANGIIQWQIVGVAIRVVSWPAVYIILAKGKFKLFILTETVWTILHILLTLIFMKWLGLEGLGLAYVGLYFLYTILVIYVARNLSGFIWTKQSLILITIGLVACAIALSAMRILPNSWALIASIAITIITSVGSVILLKKLLNINFSDIIIKRFRS